MKGDGKVDAFYVGDLIRASNLNPTLKTIAAIGGELEKGKKMLAKEDIYPMYKACKDSKDQGGFHDFLEILKLYDKNDDNTILENELFKLLINFGEKLSKEEAKGLMKELCEPADDEGFMPFIRKLTFLNTFNLINALSLQHSWRRCALRRSKNLSSYYKMAIKQIPFNPMILMF